MNAVAALRLVQLGLITIRNTLVFIREIRDQYSVPPEQLKSEWDRLLAEDKALEAEINALIEGK